MASGRCSGAKERPPALPVKQLRRLSSTPSEVDCGMRSPVGLQHPSCECDDVFSESADCHAVLCPIHRRHDASRHQVRFFSDGPPPPVPKKRLSRTLSLPGNGVPQLSPLSPLQRRPLNFDNPMYMLAPAADSRFHEEEEGDLQPASGRPVPSPSFSLLSFDTPDEHLPCLFGRIDDRRVVSQGIQRRHLLFLRSAARSAEAAVLLPRAEAAEGPYRPQDFRLSEGGEPKQVGDALYYSLQSHKLPGRVLGLRVHKHTDDTPSARTDRQPEHVNVQSVVAHFQGPGDDCGRLAAQGPSGHFKSAGEAQSGGRAALVSADVTSVESLLQEGLSVSVERDLPRATLEDFVQDGSSLRGPDRFEYDRRACALLLQVATGSRHLCDIGGGTAGAELRPRGIFLVWPSGEGGGSEASGTRGETEWGKTGGKGAIQMLWGTHGCPRVVLTPLPSARSVPNAAAAHVESQIGALIRYCLHSQDAPTPPDSAPRPSMSSLRRGLLHLSSGPRSESSGPRAADLAAGLQALLWGPRGSVTTAVHNWLTVKRALLVMKLADRGLIQDQSPPDWEDCMCLQYLSFTDPETIMSATGLLNAESAR